jgi:hypothetical protein
MSPPNRRQFVQASAVGASGLALGDLRGFLPLSPATPDEARVTPEIVQFTPEIEPVVRAIEETTQERCMEVMVALLRGGLPYRQFLAALFLAGVRNPAVSHTPLAIHAVHQLSLDAPTAERLLPTFWSLANFKYWEHYHKAADYRMPRLKEDLPDPQKAAEEFHAGMDSLDEERAERAIVALIRSEGTNRVFDTMWPYAAVNCLSVYHSAIGLANSWRTLQTIGWQHAEPMLRWMVHSFITASAAPLVSRGDWTYRENRDRARTWSGKLPAGWAGGAENAELTRRLLGLIREFKAAEACDLVVSGLAGGTCRAGAVWDATHLAAAELMMRKADVGYPLHSNTAANALHYGFRTSAEPEIRLLLLLQGVGWQCHARRRLNEQAKADPKWIMKPVKIDDLAATPVSPDPGVAAQEMLSDLGARPEAAASRVLDYARANPQPRVFVAAARRRLFAKLAVEETHDVKYPVAVFEDYAQVNPIWRPHLLASSVYWLPGAERPDSPLMRQAREAVRRI